MLIFMRNYSTDEMLNRIANGVEDLIRRKITSK